MSDIGLFIEDNCWDLKIENGDLKADNGLETAVSISLFTDRRVNDEELPFGQISKRGWWGDMFPEIDQDRIGSRLWTLERAKTNVETLRLAEDYCREALQWFIEDGVAESFEVTATFDEFFRMNLDIVINKPLGRQSRFSVLWDAQENVRSITRTA